MKNKVLKFKYTRKGEDRHSVFETKDFTFIDDSLLGKCYNVKFFDKFSNKMRWALIGLSEII